MNLEMEFEVEVLLRDFYDVLKQEYYDDSEEHRRYLFQLYFNSNINNIETNVGGNYVSEPCNPLGWNACVQLLIYNYPDSPRFFFFFQSKPNELQIGELIKDRNFKDLVKVYFYILDYSKS